MPNGSGCEPVPGLAERVRSEARRTAYCVAGDSVVCRHAANARPRAIPPSRLGIRAPGRRLAMLAYKDSAAGRLISRQSVDHTARFPALAAAVAQLTTARLVIDGAVCVFDAQLVSQFHLLGDGRPKERRLLPRSSPSNYSRAALAISALVRCLSPTSARGRDRWKSLCPTDATARARRPIGVGPGEAWRLGEPCRASSSASTDRAYLFLSRAGLPTARVVIL
jgi:hypothetical protein